jgi:Zn-dependent protease with chaperone function
VTYKVNPKENFYFSIKVITSIFLYAGIFYGIKSLLSGPISAQATIFLSYAAVIIFFVIIQLGVLIGYLKGNAVKINDHQFADIYEIVKKQCAALEMSKIPDVYLLQNGGFLNAFATSFLGKNYVVIYSDVLEEAYENNLASVEFIIGHELGHVKRKHLLKRMLLLPSAVIPFLGSAYSRACEYTCDSIGASLSPKGARTGLLLLASGKRLYKKVNTERFMYQSVSEGGFWSWFAEKISTHPKLSKRVSQFKGAEFAIEPKKIVVAETIDHSAYFPKAKAEEIFQ